MMCRSAAWLFLLLLACQGLLATEAPDIFSRLQSALPSNAGKEAVQALRAGDYARVEEILAGPAHPDAELLAIRGAVEFLAGNMRPAVQSFDKAASFTPLNDSDSFTLAMALVNLNNGARARSVLEPLASKHPDRAVYLYWLGRIDYDQRRYQEAIVNFDAAIKLDPTSARAWDSLGLAYDMQGQSQSALSSMEKARSLNRQQPRPSPWPPNDLGYLLLRLDRPADAEAALRESLRYKPDFAEARYHLARVLEKQGRTPEAITEYKSSMAADQSSADACYSLAILYRKLNQEPLADQMFAEYRKRKLIQPRPAEAPPSPSLQQPAHND